MIFFIFSLFTPNIMSSLYVNLDPLISSMANDSLQIILDANNSYFYDNSVEIRDKNEFLLEGNNSILRIYPHNEKRNFFFINVSSSSIYGIKFHFENYAESTNEIFRFEQAGKIIFEVKYFVFFLIFL